MKTKLYMNINNNIITEINDLSIITTIDENFNIIKISSELLIDEEPLIFCYSRSRSCFKRAISQSCRSFLEIKILI